MRARCAAAVIAGILGCLAAPASADPRSEIAAKARAAMASYDSMDYEAARRLLHQALAIARKAHLDKDPIVARVYLDLGITQLAGSDQEAARGALLSAAQIDPRITIDAAYRSPELVKLLDEAKAAAGDAEPADADCRSVRGLRPIIGAGDAGRPGTAQPIEVLVGGDLAPARVAVMYRPEGAIDFTEIRLVRQSSCRYTGTLPASATRGSVLHYYVAAYDAANKVLASRGSSGAPSVLELGAPAPAAADGGSDAPTDTEDPIGPPRRRPGVEVTESVAPPHKSHKAAIALAGGTSFGYVTGRTEGDNQVQKCCIGSSPVVVQAELGYYTSPRFSLGLAVRIGLPIGANIDGHSTIAPAGFVRARYALSPSGDGVRLMGEVGAGVLRNTIKLDNTMPGMDTDVVAQGPLLIGAGIGYVRHISESFAFLVDLDAMAGLAVARKLGSAVHLNTGISADMRLGFAIGF